MVVEAPAPELVEIREFYDNLLRLPAGSADPAQGAAAPAWALLGAEDRVRLSSPAGSADPALRKYDLGSPPLRHAWWNYAIYPVIGLPRDLVDGFFGVVGYVPPFNIVFTGIGYELVPTQVLMRHPRDWHRWRGHANRNGHGWVGGEAWGFFSNLHQTRFSRVDERELAIWQAHNRRMDEQLAARVLQRKQQEAALDAARQAWISETRRCYDAGEHRQVVARLHEYVGLDPRSRTARAMLVGSLAVILPDLPDPGWAEQALIRNLRASSSELLLEIRKEMDTLSKSRPESTAFPMYLLWIHHQLRNDAAAFEQAGRLVELEPANVAWRRLRVETALATRQVPWVEEAADQLARAAGDGAPETLHARGRLALLDNRPADAIPVYESLSRTDPANPRYHYLLGIARLAEGVRSGHLERRAALRSLDRAIARARSHAEKILFTDARRRAARLR